MIFSFIFCLDHFAYHYIISKIIIDFYINPIALFMSQ